MTEALLLQLSLVAYLAGTIAGAAHLVRPSDLARSSATTALAAGFLLQVTAILVRAIEFGSFAVASFAEQSAFFACLIAGHYQAGMVGKIKVVGAGSASNAAAPAAATAKSDGKAHKH